MEKKSKVALFITMGNEYGGAERRFLRIFNSLCANKDYNIFVLVKTINMNEVGRKIVLHFFKDKNKILFYKSQLLIFINIILKKYEIICFIDTSRRSYIMAILSKILGIKILFCSVTPGPSNLLFSSRKQKEKFLRMVKIADYIDCLYPLGTKKLVGLFPNKHISQTPNSFTDLNKFKQSNKENIIVFASRLVPEKNVELFLKAIYECKEILRKTGYRCIVCGYGILDETVKESIISYDIADVCSLLGYVDMADAFSKAKIFCSLQNITNYPSQSLIEATSCGCFLIITDCGESSLMAGEGFSVLVKNDSHMISEAIINCVSKSEFEWNHISYKARKFAEANYTIERSIDYYSHIFHQMIK